MGGTLAEVTARVRYNVFAAVEIPPSVIAEAGEFRRGLTGARWQAPTQMHVVVWDFGPVSQLQAVALDMRLEAIQVDPFDVNIEGVAISGNGEISSGVGTHPSFDELRRRCRSEARRLKLPELFPGQRRGPPRLVLGKASEPNLAEASAWLEAHQDFAVGPVPISGFGLFQQDKDQFGPWAEKVGEYSLRSKASVR